MDDEILPWPLLPRILSCPSSESKPDRSISAGSGTGTLWLQVLVNTRKTWNSQPEFQEAQKTAKSLQKPKWRLGGGNPEGSTLSHKTRKSKKGWNMLQGKI